MADVKISELTALTSPDGAEELVVNDGGTTKKITITNATSASLSKTGGTMTGDTFHGNNVAARFGAGNALSINHTGSYSSIVDSGTGDLWIGADANVNIANAALNEYKAQFISNGAVNLYHNNVAKFSTTATGVAITGGIAIGGTGAANTLDDYEEGTWTAVVGTGTATGSNASYTKVGRIVTATLQISAFSDRSSGTSINITGLPFGSISGRHGGSLMSRYVNNSDNQVYVSNTSISIYGNSSGSWSQLLHSDLNNSGSELYISITYQTA